MGNDELSRDVRRHVALVYAVLTVTMAASGVGCFQVLPFLPLQLSFVAVFFIAVVAQSVGRIAYECTPVERVVVRFVLSVVSYVIGSVTFLVICVQVNPDQDASIIHTTLFAVAVIFASFSFAAIVVPHKRVMLLVAYGLELVVVGISLTTALAGGITLFNSALEAMLGLLLIVIFNVFLAWQTDVIIQKATDDECDVVTIADKFISDLSNAIASVVTYPFRWVWRRCKGGGSGEKEPLLMDAAA